MVFLWLQHKQQQDQVIDISHRTMS